MDFFEVVQQRRSVRVYQAKPIEEEMLHRILETLNQAPSAGNLQAYDVVVVREMERRQALSRAAWDQTFILEAPVALVFFANPERNVWRYGSRGAELYCVQDATIACTYAHLTATALGLASCWVGAFDDDAVRRVVGAPSSWRPVAILPIGYPAEHPEPRARRSLRDTVHWEQVRSAR
jgi:nitroreductase